MTHPYSDLPERQFWSTAVGRREALDIRDLWTPKFRIVPKDRVVTFGSCFAEHFSRALVGRGWGWTDFEPPPVTLDAEMARQFNYGVFSARTGNIYSARMMQQWLEWAVGAAAVPDIVWEKDGRFYDPFRPAIEPEGFASPEELRASRELTLEALARAVRDCTVFVFTLGLTECWRDIDNFEYAVCPGTVAGRFDASRHRFVNQSSREVVTSMREVLRILEEANPNIRVLLTVSPVPLTATASGEHVLVATSRSKSVLRAAADVIADENRRVDYFPSYEIITAPPFEGRFFAENKRSVRQEGVDHVMAQFFAGQQLFARKAEKPARLAPAELAETIRRRAAHAAPKPMAKSKNGAKRKQGRDADDVVCEDLLLGAFAPNSGRTT